jgi:hypothetical protein
MFIATFHPLTPILHCMKFSKILEFQEKKHNNLLRSLVHDIYVI